MQQLVPCNARSGGPEYPMGCSIGVGTPPRDAIRFGASDPAFRTIGCRELVLCMLGYKLVVISLR